MGERRRVGEREREGKREGEREGERGRKRQEDLYHDILEEIRKRYPFFREIERYSSNLSADKDIDIDIDRDIDRDIEKKEISINRREEKVEIEEIEEIEVMKRKSLLYRFYNRLFSILVQDLSSSPPPSFLFSEHQKIQKEKEKEKKKDVKYIQDVSTFISCLHLPSWFPFLYHYLLSYENGRYLSSLS